MNTRETPAARIIRRFGTPPTQASADALSVTSSVPTTTIEGPTNFQNRPAYRYIRAADRLPTYTQLPEGDAIAQIKLFDPCGSWTWYLAAYDPDTRQAWGAVDGFEYEYGSIDMEELCTFRNRFGLPIERDLFWRPRPLRDCIRN